MKSFVLAVAAFVLATGCAASQENADESGAAATGTDAPNLLDECPALGDDLITMSSTVAPSSRVVVEQRIPLFDGSGESVNMISPEVHYDIRFTRAADGSVKFTMSVAPFFGISRSIESADKRAQVSGKVVMNADKRSGTLDVDSRREVLERISGQRIGSFAFSGLRCGDGPSFTMTAPVISLEKSGSGSAAKDALGRDVEVTPKVNWRTRAPSGQLRFRPTFG
jgi:hypothetical protein